MADDKILKKIGENLEQINNRLGKVENSLISLEKGQDELKRGQSSLKRRMKRVEKDVSFIAETFDANIANNRQRLDRVEDHLGLPPLKN